ncbi:CaiB/BaiF CoA transferase family protein [Aestuariirhabdus litorea]|uniref:CoA transferase n=1 Tax=Aestuariirhabdus litorea TaxID=2528527 RepID=A0A3P3VI60_9GAMM|nr:CoA transferase [Aestuariirhabdus litorea]RRJ82415.1 CoA transferase [Aestuariirhabdus litorea]RWW92578.1 CoA transferase [Endozoicomonadaceae bacterium GTF-13]
MKTILEGIKVIEVATMAAGPSAGVILADFGAEVIKVEVPTGDPWRYGHLIAGMPPSKIPYTTYFRNRTKKSVSLNLKHPSAQEILHKLVESADVLLTNSPLKVQQDCAHTYEDIRKINPRIIFGWVNGFGLKGPDKDLPGFDVTASWARCGIAEQARPKGGSPTMQPIGLGDSASATALFGAIMTGLFHRERTGEGCKVSTSLMNNGLWSNGSMVQAALVGAPPMEKYHRDEWPQAVMGAIYKTRDDRYVLVNELNPNNAAGVWEALGATHLSADERFSTAEMRAKNVRVLWDEIQQVFSSLELADVEKRFKSNGVNHGVIQTPAECATDEHMMANGCFPEIEGTPGHRTIDSPIQIEGFEKVKPRKVSEIGGDTVTEMKAVGYSEAQIQRLAEEGAVHIAK